ncbi:Serine/threonine-protein phosphatase 2A activator [Halotydeus destructor]|nr:Serine/threonine-protein phosphatase 2A activator [Halotydeus destructor]
MSSEDGPKRQIFGVQHMSHWSSCPGYKEYLGFVKQLNEFAKGVHDGFYDRKTIENAALQECVSLLDRLSDAVDKIEPIDDSNQRFGNKSFRTWFDQMKLELDVYFQSYSDEVAKELEPYLEQSFGNQQRIDYGTGHEMNFVIFLMGLSQLVLSVNGSVPHDQLRTLCHQMLTLFAAVYMPLVRKIQLRYNLEPAGSHGVFSLDDFQFLPFLFGSAQLIRHPSLEPRNFYEPNISEANAEKFMFHGAVNYIHKVKTGPFAEHSNQLWNISAVEEWSKINKGLTRMYCDEVLSKFPIVQHLAQVKNGSRFLVKVNFEKVSIGPKGKSVVTQVEEEHEEDEHGSENITPSGQQVYKHEYHVVYSETYQVPVLYFNVTKQDGSYLSIEEIWSNIPVCLRPEPPGSEPLSRTNEGEKAAEESDNGTLAIGFQHFGHMVTQMEHPLLGLPYFMVHPCNTSRLMALSRTLSHQFPEQGNTGSSCSYLLTWLSVVGPVARLSIDPMYVTSQCTNK